MSASHGSGPHACCDTLMRPKQSDMIRTLPSYGRTEVIPGGLRRGRSPVYSVTNCGRARSYSYLAPFRPTFQSNALVKQRRFTSTLIRLAFARAKGAFPGDPDVPFICAKTNPALQRRGLDVDSRPHGRQRLGTAGRFSNDGRAVACGLRGRDGRRRAIQCPDERRRRRCGIALRRRPAELFHSQGHCGRSRHDPRRQYR